MSLSDRSSVDEIILVLLEPNDVDDFEDTKRVQDEHDDEPCLLVVSGGAPKCETFPDERPDDEYGDKGKNGWA